MKNFIAFVLLSASIGVLSSCDNTATVEVDSDRQQAIVDSIVAYRTQEITDSMTEVCLLRFEKEVESKVDSIVKANK